jgi:uncharacterized protein YggE
MRLRLLLLTLFLTALAAPAAHAQATERTITVVGSGAVTAVNDTAFVGLRVSTTRRTPGAALNVTSRRTRAVVAAIRALDVATEDIQTQEVAIRKVFRRTGRGKRRFVGYRAINSVAVTVRQIRATGALIAAGLRAGATSVSGAEFTVSNADALYNDALAGAYRNARSKAELLAAEAGVTLGAVIEIREGVPALDSSGFEEFADALASAIAAPIEPGTSTVATNVTVTYAISG